jgi:hypothetical protein
MEAAFRFNEPLRTLDCPVLLTSKDDGQVSASITNTTEREIEFRYRAIISQGSATLVREENTAVLVPADAVGIIYWGITPQDAAYGNLILVKVRRFPKFGFPASEGSCGVMFVDTSIMTGVQLLILSLASGFSLMAIGTALWFSLHRPLKADALATARSMVALLLFIGVSTILGLLGFWLFAGIALVITALLIAVIIGLYLTKAEST